MTTQNLTEKKENQDMVQPFDDSNESQPMQEEASIIEEEDDELDKMEEEYL